MSKSTANSGGVNAAKKAAEGKWTLGYSANRSERLRLFQDFRDDCEKHHQRYTGSEIGPYLRRRSMPDLPVSDQPIPPRKADHEVPGPVGENDLPTAPVLDEVTYRVAMDTYERDKNLWLLNCKNVESFKFECNKTHLPKLFVWIQERLEPSLRVRLEAHANWQDLEHSNPRDPLTLLDLIETVMSKGDINDVGYDKYESLKDLFSPGMLMKNGQSLADYEKVIRGRMRFMQSKHCWMTESIGDDGEIIKSSVLDEEFFVNLMFDNLTKSFDNAKIDYVNDIASSAVERKTTFDDFVQYFSTILSHDGKHVATTLTTNAKKSKKKGMKKDGKGDGKPTGKFKPDGSDDPRRTRNCSLCDGTHWDDHCPSKSKKKGGDNSKKNAPSTFEVKNAMDSMRKDKTAMSSETLVTFGEVKMADLTVDQIQNYCQFVKDSQESA